MDNNFEFNLPATMRDIKLSQWQKYVDVLEKNKDAELTDFLEKKLLGIFCGVELKDIDRIGLSVFDSSIQHLSSVLNSKPELIRTFKLTGTDGVTVEFGLIPNFDKMSYGEFVDLEKYLFVDKDFHRAMAVMYRPIKFKNKDSYLIHDYKGTEYLAEVMKDTPLDVALGARVFFYRLGMKLSRAILNSSRQLLEEDSILSEEEKSVLTKNIAGIKSFTHLQGELLSKSTKLL